MSEQTIQEGLYSIPVQLDKYICRSLGATTIKDLVKNKEVTGLTIKECDKIKANRPDVLILNKGETVLKGNLKEIKEQYNANRVSLSTIENVDKYIKELGLEIYNSKDNDYIINISGEEDGYKLINKLIENKVKVEKFEIMKPSLNDIFIEKVGEAK